MHRSHKHQQELLGWQQRRNDLIRPRRALVEKVFGTLKRVYRVRYRGLQRNGAEMWFKLMAYNATGGYHRLHVCHTRVVRSRVGVPWAGPARQSHTCCPRDGQVAQRLLRE